MKAVELGAVAAPSIGPAIVTFWGLDVPVLSLTLSCLGLLFARTIAPPPLRKLTKWQHRALTGLLLLVLFVIVTGGVTGKPLGYGTATMVGIGLGFSGLVAIELFASRGMKAFAALVGGDAPPPPPPTNPEEPQS